jgi:hypothetical protein
MTVRLRADVSTANTDDGLLRTAGLLTDHRKGPP